MAAGHLFGRFPSGLITLPACLRRTKTGRKSGWKQQQLLIRQRNFLEYLQLLRLLDVLQKLWKQLQQLRPLALFCFHCWKRPSRKWKLWSMKIWVTLSSGIQTYCGFIEDCWWSLKCGYLWLAANGVWTKALMKAVTWSTSLAQVLVLESAPGGSFCNRDGEDKDESWLHTKTVSTVTITRLFVVNNTVTHQLAVTKHTFLSVFSITCLFLGIKHPCFLEDSQGDKTVGSKPNPWNHDPGISLCAAARMNLIWRFLPFPN